MPGVSDWLKKASSDLKASKKLSDDTETLDCCVFHTHQCVEKALKAFVVLIQQSIPKTHDLSGLLERCMKVDFEFTLLWDECEMLNSYGQDSRYPNDKFYINQHLAEEAIEMAEKVLRVVKKKLDVS